MKYDTLRTILQSDGTYQEMQEAILTGELTQEEQNRIYAYLAADIDQADALFQEILDDVQKIPTFDTAAEGKQGWKDIRQELLTEIHELETRMKDTQDKIAKYEKDYETLLISEQLGAKATDAIRNIQAEIARETNDLSIQTHQHAALAMMHAHAKSQIAQERAREWTERTQPIRDDLKASWRGIGDYIKEFRKEVATWQKSLETDKVYPLADRLNNMNVRRATAQFVELQNSQKRVKEHEDKMIENIQKRMKLQYEMDMKNAKLGFKGINPIDPSKENFSTLEDAEKALKKMSTYEHTPRKMRKLEKEMEKLKKEHEKFQKAVKKREARLQKRMDPVRANLEKRRNEYEMDKAEFVHGIENGDYHIGHNSAKVADNLERRNLESYLDTGNFSLNEDLAKYLKEHDQYKNLFHLDDGPERC